MKSILVGAADANAKVQEVGEGLDLDLLLVFSNKSSLPSISFRTKSACVSLKSVINEYDYILMDCMMTTKATSTISSRTSMSTNMSMSTSTSTNTGAISSASASLLQYRYRYKYNNLLVVLYSVHILDSSCLPSASPCLSHHVSRNLCSRKFDPSSSPDVSLLILVLLFSSLLRVIGQLEHGQRAGQINTMICPLHL